MSIVPALSCHGKENDDMMTKTVSGQLDDFHCVHDIESHDEPDFRKITDHRDIISC